MHLQVRGVFPVGRHVQVTMFGGPSFYKVEQAHRELDPLHRVLSLRRGGVRQRRDGHGGRVEDRRQPRAETSATSSRIRSASGLVPSSTRATLEFPSADGGTVEVKAGGFQVVGGLRLRF